MEKRRTEGFLFLINTQPFFSWMLTTRQFATANLNIGKEAKIVIIDGLMILNKYLINQIFQRTDTKTTHTYKYT